MKKKKLFILLMLSLVVSCTKNDTNSESKTNKNIINVQTAKSDEEFVTRLNSINDFNRKLQMSMDKDVFIKIAAEVLSLKIINKYNEDSVKYYQTLHSLDLSQIESAAQFLRHNINMNREGLTDCLLNLSISSEIKEHVNFCLSKNLIVSKMKLSDSTPKKMYEILKSSSYLDILKPYLKKMNISESDLINQYEEL